MIALITGASGGFGSVLGELLVNQGMKTYGTCRNPDSKGRSYPFTMLPMEITDAASVERCIDEVIKREGRIDVLINCVNEMILGMVEEQTVEEVRALFDANVFGTLRVCQKVLPIMRRQGGGTIINMSSLGGIVAVPMMSAYTSAKFAMEAMSEALYHEVRHEGIHVVIMQPVAMRMEREANSTHLRRVDGVKPDSPTYLMEKRMEKDTMASNLTPEAVAQRVYDVILTRKKPLRVPMDRAKPLSLVKALAPQFVIDHLLDGLTKK